MKREPSRFAGSNVQISCTRLGSAHVFILIRSNKCTLGGTGFLLILQVETIFIYKPIITNHTLPQGASQFMRHIYPSLLDKETPPPKKKASAGKKRKKRVMLSCVQKNHNNFDDKNTDISAAVISIFIICG